MPHRNRARLRPPSPVRRPSQTLYRDLERDDDRLPEAILAEAHAWCRSGSVVWTPPRPRQNPAEVLAVLGALWGAAQDNRDSRWDGASLRGENILPTVAERAAIAAGKGGIHLVGRDGRQIALRGARADLWFGQVTAEKIWNSCRTLIDESDWNHTSLDGSITGYDPSSYWRPIDLGWSADEQGFAAPLRPAVEMMAMAGAEALHRANAWRRKDWAVWLPLIVGIPLRDWQDARALLRAARSAADWAETNPSFAAAGAQQPLLCRAPLLRMGRGVRLGWI